MKKKDLFRAIAGVLAAFMLFTGVKDYSIFSMAAENEEETVSESAVLMEEDANDDIKDEVSEEEQVVIPEEQSVSEETTLNEDTEATVEMFAKTERSAYWEDFIADSSDKNAIKGVKNKDKKELVIPKEAKKILKGAFTDCANLEKVTFEKGCGLTKIGEGAFEDVKSLKSITFPSTLTTIEKSAFVNTGLTSVTFPASVAVIGESAFEHADNLEAIVFDEDSAITTISQKAFYSTNSKLKSLVIPSSVTTIGKKAFSGYSKLEGISIPENVTKIGDFAFEGCGIKTVSVNSLLIGECGDNIFKGCKINSVEFNPAMTVVPKNLFSNAGFENAEIYIPIKVKSIGEGAFKNAVSLNAVYFMGTAINTIDKEAFMGSTIKTMAIPSSVKTIGESAFAECNNLETITIPEGVKKIESYAFKDCVSLNKVYLPKSVYKMGDKKEGDKTHLAFEGCKKGLTFYVIKGSSADKTWASLHEKGVQKDDNPASFAYNGFELVRTLGIKYTLGTGGVNAWSNPGSFAEGEAVTLSSPVRYGYTFKSWKIGKTEYTPDANGKVTIPAKTKGYTIKAVWTKNIYTVTYDPNGGTIKNSSKQYNIGKAITHKKPTREGYTFAGWYIGGMKVNTFKKGVYYGGDVTVVAKWKKAVLTIKFDGNGATKGEMEDITVVWGSEDAFLPKCTFEKDGYEFTYWKSPKVTVADEGYVGRIASKGTVTLVAQWEKKE